MTAFFNSRLCAYPHVSKIQSWALFGGFVTFFKAKIYSARKNPGVWFERDPDKAKNFEANAYPSELAGPGIQNIYFALKFNIFLK